MEQRLDLYRTPGERPLPKGLVEPVRKRGGRPKLPVGLHVRTGQDVELLRRRNVPVRLLTPESVSDAGYPMIFEPRLVGSSGIRVGLRGESLFGRSTRNSGGMGTHASAATGPIS